MRKKQNTNQLLVFFLGFSLVAALAIYAIENPTFIRDFPQQKSPIHAVYLDSNCPLCGSLEPIVQQLDSQRSVSVTRSADLQAYGLSFSPAIVIPTIELDKRPEVFDLIIKLIDSPGIDAGIKDGQYVVITTVPSRLSASSCPQNGTVRVDYFFSPTDQLSTANEPILSELQSRFPEVTINKFCVLLNPDDSQFCSGEFEGSRNLAGLYGIPGYIFNCEYRKQGTWVLTNPETEMSILSRILCSLESIQGCPGR